MTGKIFAEGSEKILTLQRFQLPKSWINKLRALRTTNYVHYEPQTTCTTNHKLCQQRGPEN